MIGIMVKSMLAWSTDFGGYHSPLAPTLLVILRRSVLVIVPLYGLLALFIEGGDYLSVAQRINIPNPL